MMIFKNVSIFKIKSNNDKRGFFREIFKVKQLKYNNKLKQISHSFIKKNVLKGWHFHKKQIQWNYLLEGKIRLFLLDNRIKSKTYLSIKSFILDSKKNNFVYCIPPNVGHAYLTIADVNHMIYGTSDYYNPQEEFKLPFNKDLLKKYKIK